MFDNDPQSLFDACVIGLSSQGGRSLRLHGGRFLPAFRGMGNRKCAVGMFIPDEFYDRQMEGCGVADVFEVKKYPDLNQNMPWLKRNENLFRSLMNEHDLIQSMVFSDPIVNRLKGVAAKYKLDPAMVDSLPWPEFWE